MSFFCYLTLRNFLKLHNTRYTIDQSLSNISWPWNQFPGSNQHFIKDVIHQTEQKRSACITLKMLFCRTCVSDCICGSEGVCMWICHYLKCISHSGSKSKTFAKNAKTVLLNPETQVRPNWERMNGRVFPVLQEPLDTLLKASRKTGMSSG